MNPVAPLLEIDHLVVEIQSMPALRGFSMRVTQALRDVDADFAAMDILPDPRIRQVLSARSGWPTIPQLFVDGELVGGCDIVMELHESGELAQLVKPAAA